MVTNRRHDGIDSVPKRPDMKLSVSTHHGFSPLSLVLEGAILETDRSEFESCLVTVEWTDKTPDGQALISRKESPCVDPPAGTTLPESFKLKVNLPEPGTSSYRMILASKAGKRFASTSQEVEVIKSAFEVGATTTRSDNR